MLLISLVDDHLFTQQTSAIVLEKFDNAVLGVGEVGRGTAFAS
jgi:hypothetical protein